MIKISENHLSLSDLGLINFPNEIEFQGHIFYGHAMNEKGDAIYLSKTNSTYLFIYNS